MREVTNCTCACHVLVEMLHYYMYYICNLRSITMSDRVKYKRNSLACKMQEDSACNTGDSVVLTNRQESSSARKHVQWSSKNKKRTCPVLILATWCHTNESVHCTVFPHRALQQVSYSSMGVVKWNLHVAL